MRPNEEARYRETTVRTARFGVSITRRCHGCKKTRSIKQFSEGKKTCKQCRAHLGLR